MGMNYSTSLQSKGLRFALKFDIYTVVALSCHAPDIRGNSKLFVALYHFIGSSFA